MAAPRKPALDKLVDLYVAMSPEERRVVPAVIRGIDRALGNRPAAADEQATFEELGERAAEVTA